MAWLPDGGKILMIRLFALTRSTNVTDTQTDRQTHTHTHTHTDRMTAKAALAEHRLAKLATKAGLKRHKIITKQRPVCDS